MTFILINNANQFLDKFKAKLTCRKKKSVIATTVLNLNNIVISLRKRIGAFASSITESVSQGFAHANVISPTHFSLCFPTTFAKQQIISFNKSL